jgi:hypothetical protein
VQRPWRVRAGQQGTRAQRGYTVPARPVDVLCRGYISVVPGDIRMVTAPPVSPRGQLSQLLWLGTLV